MASEQTRITEKNRPWLVVTLTCLALCIASFLLVKSCAGDRQTRLIPEAVVDLDRIEKNELILPTAVPTPDRLRVAVAPVLSPEKSLEAYHELVKYLSDKLGRRAVFLTGKDYSEVNNIIRLEQCDMALICTYAFIVGERDFGMKLLAVPQIHGQRIYRSFIITPRSNSATTMLELRGTKFASADVMSTSGWLYPMTQLKALGTDPGTFFSKHVISGSHDRSIQAVRSGLVDAAAVDSLVFEQLARKDPTLREEIKVIHQSEAFGMPPLVVPADLPPSLVDDLRSTLFQMHKDPTGQRILKALSIDQFVEVNEAAYESVRQLITSWENKP